MQILFCVEAAIAIRAARAGGWNRPLGDEFRIPQYFHSHPEEDCMSNAHEEAARTNQKADIRNVVVRGSAAGFAQEIVAGPHRFVSDEPLSAGGTDTGPSPYDLLLAALGSCT